MSIPAVKTVVAYVTTPSKEVGTKLARTVVTEGLVGCANIIPGVTSVYQWKGEIEEDEEHVVLLKTVDSNVQKLEERVKSLHPAETPCFFTLPIDRISNDFGKWLIDSTKVTESG
uniref:Divalent-cation tolerance protein CutA n=1 Tax=Caenorhabditis japonica TaxID=281687 RepID=A0A8R1I7L4_CAEJA